MKPTKLTEYQLKRIETSQTHTLKDIIEYLTEIEVNRSIVTPQEAVEVLFTLAKSLKYEIAVTRAGLRQVTKEKDRLSQRDLFVS